MVAIGVQFEVALGHIRLSVVSMRMLCSALLDAHSSFIISIPHMRKQTCRS